MANNNFKSFGTSNGANVTSQADYEALAAVLTGFTAGKASSAQINKVLRQGTVMSSVLAQFISDTLGVDVLDNGVTTNILANLIKAIQLTAQNSTVSTLTGVVGQTRNAAMYVSTPSATGTFSADEIIVENPANGSQYRISGFNKNVNLTSVGAGGMDSGSAPVNGYVGLYAIYNPVGKVSSLVAVNASQKLSEIYSGSNMPAGYTASALISVWATDSSGLLKTGTQNQRLIRTDLNVLLDSTSTPSTATALNISSSAPQNAKVCYIHSRSRAVAGTGSLGVAFASNQNLLGVSKAGFYIGTGQSSNSYDTPATTISIITLQTIYYYTTVIGPTSYQYTIYCSGYEF